MFEHGMRCLAEVVSCTIDLFRKAGELSLIPEVCVCVACACMCVCVCVKVAEVCTSYHFADERGLFH